MEEEQSWHTLNAAEEQEQQLSSVWEGSRQYILAL